MFKKRSIDVDVLLVNSIVNRKLTFNYRPNYTTRDVFPSDDPVTVKTLNFLNFPFICSVYLNIVVSWFLKKHTYNLVHFHFLWNVFGRRCLDKRGTPYIITCHGCDVNALSLKPPFIQHLYMKQLNRAHHVIFVSQFLKKNAIKLGYTPSSSTIIPNGIDLSIFSPPSSPIKKPFHIGFVGSLIPVKRAELLPRIFLSVKQHIPELTMTIVGEGHLRDSITQEFDAHHALQDVFFTGNISPPEVATEMKQMSILLLPSIREGWPCVVLEAQASGTSVVGSANAGMPEAIEEGGCVVEDGENVVQRFADAVVSLLNTPIPQYRLVDRASHYSWESLIKKELRVYDTLLGDNHVRS